MTRSEQARMPVGLAFPGSGPVSRPAATPPAAFSSARRWFVAMNKKRRAGNRRLMDCLEGVRTAYFLALFACASLFGLVVGGYAGFMEAATPHGGTQASLAQLATSDGQWVAMMRQSRASPGGRLRSWAESQGVSLWRPAATGASGTAEDVASATPLLSTLACGHLRDGECLQTKEQNSSRETQIGR
jgi:hypothetical protein